MTERNEGMYKYVADYGGGICNSSTLEVVPIADIGLLIIVGTIAIGSLLFLMWADRRGYLNKEIELSSWFWKLLQK